MPYYLFEVRQDKSDARLLGSFDQFREASTQAKALRRELPAASNAYIKVTQVATYDHHQNPSKR